MTRRPPTDRGKAVIASECYLRHVAVCPDCRGACSCRRCAGTLPVLCLRGRVLRRVADERAAVLLEKPDDDEDD